MPDPCNLRRFVDAQAGVYDEVIRELRAGRKRTHWMWFVFPQLTGLGRTVTAHRFGIGSLDEARAYLADPVLGSRLRECAGLLRDYPGREPIEVVLGDIDALKLRSSMTLFLRAGDEADRELFQAVLDRYYCIELDGRTLELLSEG
jgi:uncharacterized protein (DUF1810 family)